jgi:hypothetical protein
MLIFQEGRLVSASSLVKIQASINKEPTHMADLLDRDFILSDREPASLRLHDRRSTKP